MLANVPLMVAAMAGHADVVRMLLKCEKVDVNAGDPTALMGACLAGTDTGLCLPEHRPPVRSTFVDIIRMLLSKSDIALDFKSELPFYLPLSIQNPYSLAALHHAVEMDFVQAVDLLLTAGADANLRSGQRRWTPLHYAMASIQKQAGQARAYPDFRSMKDDPTKVVMHSGHWRPSVQSTVGSIHDFTERYAVPSVAWDSAHLIFAQSPWDLSILRRLLRTPGIDTSLTAEVFEYDGSLPWDEAIRRHTITALDWARRMQRTDSRWNSVVALFQDVA